jgi:hypothetical protein
MVVRTSLSLILIAALAVAAAADKPPERADGPGALVVIDSSGNVQKLKGWKFTAGTRHLSWLAPPPAAGGRDEKDRAPKARRPVAVGPEALEFREEDSTQFVEGVLTLVPLDRLRNLEYDGEEKSVTAHVANGPKFDQDILLSGTTRFDRVNKIVIEAEVDNGDAGIADVKFLGGTQRGIRGIRFLTPKPTAAAPGRPATVTLAGKTPATHKVTDLQALYRLASGYERSSPLLMFKKTYKLEVTKIHRITAAGPEDDEGAWQVQLKEGGDQTLTLLRVIQLDGQDAQFEGLVGRVPAGYKLFPFITLGEVVFDEAEPAGDAKPATDAKNDK